MDEPSDGLDQPTLFSMVFGVANAITAPWFDPVLIRDSPVFVDPFLLDLCEEPEFEGASDQVFEHFRVLFRLVAEDPRAEIGELLRFPEFAEACLGYTEGGVDGAGSGPSRASAMRAAIGNAIRAGLESPKHFEELSLLAPRIGRDLISDITLRILAPRFMDYTARVAHELGVETEPTRIDAFRSVDDDIWPSAYVANLPRNPHSLVRRGIVLVPKVLLRELPTINKSSFEDFLYRFHIDDLRARFNITVKRQIAARILSIANANPNWVRQYTEYEDSRRPRPYDFVRDPRSVGIAYRHFYEAALLRAGLPSPSSAADVLDFVRGITHVFKIEVEENEGYTLLYRDAACTDPKDEKSVQRLFAATARGMCKQAGVFMTKESDAGAGPVDFVFTTEYQSTVLLEIKLIRNGDFWNGIGGQLPAYMRGHDADTGMVVGVAFTDGEVKHIRYTALTDFARQVGEELGFTVAGERIDARPQSTPPSKRKSAVKPPRR